MFRWFPEAIRAGQRAGPCPTRGARSRHCPAESLPAQKTSINGKSFQPSMKLIFATGNAGKLREAREILEPQGIGVVSPYDLGLTKEQIEVDETGLTFAENAAIKVRHLWALTGLPCFADDSGLEVDALGGAPGIYTARYASLDGQGEDHNFTSNIAKLLHNLQGVTDRRARFVCAVALALPAQGAEAGKGPVVNLFEGKCEGRIAFEEAGCGGFGYDPVFIADAFPDRTLAEVEESAKNAVSHRGHALAAMVRYLKSL